MQNIAPSDRARDAAREMPDDDWSALVEFVADGVLETANGVVIRANLPAARLLCERSDADALIGSALAELLEPVGEGPLERDPQEIVLCRVLGSGSERHVDLRTRALGRSRALHLVIDPGKGEPADGALLDASRDLFHARGEAQTVRRAFEEAVAERRELVGVVCHELRTPITVIRGYAKLLLSGAVGPLNDEQRRFIEESAKSCGRLDGFVEQLLRAASEERAALDEPVLADASLAPVLDGVVEYLRPVLEERGVRVELELDPAALWARFDASRIEQVVANLVGNGLEHATDGAVLRIHTGPARDDATDSNDGASWVEVGVSDLGPGVAESDRHRIFEPYVRRSSADCERGLGLGLSICRRIVEAHGGQIWVRPAAAPDGSRSAGSCFVFTLPAATPEVESPAAEREE